MNILKYALIRLAVFFVVWGACVYLGTGWVIATVIAAVVALAAGYLFFNRLRLAAGQDLANAWEGRPGQRGRQEQSDMDVEDAYTEGRFFDPSRGSSGRADGPAGSHQQTHREQR